MRHFYFISFLLLFFISCEKEESLNTEVPEWLQPRLEELANSGQCYGCAVTRITFDNEYYYHLYCGYWSCMYCQLYDSSGKLVEWSADNFNSFLSEKKDEVVLWTCPNRE